MNALRAKSFAASEAEKAADKPGTPAKPAAAATTPPKPAEAPKPAAAATKPAEAPKPAAAAAKPAEAPKPAAAATKPAEAPKPAAAATKQAEAPKPAAAATKQAQAPKPAAASAAAPKQAPAAAAAKVGVHLGRAWDRSCTRPHLPSTSVHVCAAPINIPGRSPPTRLSYIASPPPHHYSLPLLQAEAPKQAYVPMKMSAEVCWHAAAPSTSVVPCVWCRVRSCVMLLVCMRLCMCVCVSLSVCVCLGVCGAQTQQRCLFLGK
jgi:hypothetical protein